MTLAGSGAAPAFAIKSGNEGGTGKLTYGSCIFTVTGSTCGAGHRLALGQTFTVTPCVLNLATAGQEADAKAGSLNVSLVLGTSTSNPLPVTATSNPNGTITLNGAQVGQVAVVAATGASN